MANHGVTVQPNTGFNGNAIMNAMNNVLNQVLTSSRVYMTWLTLRTPEGAPEQTGAASLAPAKFNESWNQFSALTPVHGIPELTSPLSD